MNQLLLPSDKTRTREMRITPKNNQSSCLTRL